MNPKEKIAKLEGLLVRVRERADGPRPNGAALMPPPAARAASLPAEALEEVVEAEADQHPTAPPPSMGAALPPVATPFTEGTASASLSSIPPLQTGWSEPPPTHVEAGPSIDMDDVEVSSEIVEVDIDIDEPGLLMGSSGLPAESGAQPVSAHVEAEPEAAEPELEEPPTALVEEASLAPPPPANEVVEPAPSSSPRAITSEIYEEESAPRHTPPPESGKQATAPSVRPEPARKSSSPPAGEGMLGAWREPGVAAPREQAPSVAPRSPARIPPPPPPPPAQAAPPPPPPPAYSAPPLAPPPVSARPSRLSPEVTRPDFPADAAVMQIEGEVAVFAPSTFGDLLDASLAL